MLDVFLDRHFDTVAFGGRRVFPYPIGGPGAVGNCMDRGCHGDMRIAAVGPTLVNARTLVIAAHARLRGGPQPVGIITPTRRGLHDPRQWPDR